MDSVSGDLLANRLLAWYDRHARVLPWRVTGGRRPDPYQIWLSEVMLQQTTVTAVIPYFQEFLRRWPTVSALAAAPVEDVLAAWAGLGYYARARNLHKCARLVAEWRGGQFPGDEAGLRQLPGIGEYTAAAIAAIAYDRPAVVVDGNVERVMARLFAVEQPLPAVKARLKALAADLSPAQRAGDYAQAVMDLGATLCTPRKPACGVCPWRGSCRGFSLGVAEDLPAKVRRPERPTRFGVAFWAQRADGAVLLRRRPDSGLLGGMLEVPSTGWRDGPWSLEEAVAGAPVAGKWRALPGVVGHSFTHFHLNLTVAAGRVARAERPSGIWCPLDGLAEQGLPTVMRKVVRHALAKNY